MRTEHTALFFSAPPLPGILPHLFDTSLRNPFHSLVFIYVRLLVSGTCRLCVPFHSKVNKLIAERMFFAHWELGPPNPLYFLARSFFSLLRIHVVQS